MLWIVNNGAWYWNRKCKNDDSHQNMNNTANTCYSSKVTYISMNNTRYQHDFKHLIELFHRVDDYIYSEISLRRTHHKADTSVKRTPIQGMVLGIKHIEWQSMSAISISSIHSHIRSPQKCIHFLYDTFQIFTHFLAISDMIQHF